MAAAPASSSKVKAKKKRGCRGCMKGCGVFVLVMLLIVGTVAGLFYRVPEKLHLFKTAAEKQLVMTPDREGASALLAEAQQRGLNTQGVSLYVFSKLDGKGSVAAVVLDARDGFAFSRSGDLDPVGNTFVQIAGGAKAKELGVDRVAMTYVSKNGNELMSLTAPVDAIMTFANKGLDQKQFIAAIDGDINLPALVNEQVQAFQELTKDSSSSQ